MMMTEMSRRLSVDLVCHALCCVASSCMPCRGLGWVRGGVVKEIRFDVGRIYPRASRSSRGGKGRIRGIGVDWNEKGVTRGRFQRRREVDIDHVTVKTTHEPLALRLSDFDSPSA